MRRKTESCVKTIHERRPATFYTSSYRDVKEGITVGYETMVSDKAVVEGGTDRVHT